jgi:hypothetical protein
MKHVSLIDGENINCREEDNKLEKTYVPMEEGMNDEKNLKRMNDILLR